MGKSGIEAVIKRKTTVWGIVALVIFYLVLGGFLVIAFMCGEPTEIKGGKIEGMEYVGDSSDYYVRFAIGYQTELGRYSYNRSTGEYYYDEDGNYYVSKYGKAQYDFVYKSGGEYIYSSSGDYYYYVGVGGNYTRKAVSDGKYCSIGGGEYCRSNGYTLKQIGKWRFAKVNFFNKPLLYEDSRKFNSKYESNNQKEIEVESTFYVLIAAGTIILLVPLYGFIGCLVESKKTRLKLENGVVVGKNFSLPVNRITFASAERRFFDKLIRGGSTVVISSVAGKYGVHYVSNAEEVAECINAAVRGESLPEAAPVADINVGTAVQSAPAEVSEVAVSNAAASAGVSVSAPAPAEVSEVAASNIAAASASAGVSVSAPAPAEVSEVAASNAAASACVSVSAPAPAEVKVTPERTENATSKKTVNRGIAIGAGVLFLTLLLFEFVFGIINMTDYVGSYIAEYVLDWIMYAGFAAACFLTKGKKLIILPCLCFFGLAIYNFVCAGEAGNYSKLCGYFALTGIIFLFFLVFFGGVALVKNFGSKIWFLPAALFFVSYVYNLALDFGAMYFITRLLFIAAIGLAGFMFTKTVKESEAVQVSGGEATDGSAPAGAPASGEYNGFCDLGKHILLLLFTFGIWRYIWIYRVTKYLNKVSPHENRDATTVLLLCIFVPFYAIYWSYKSGQIIDNAARKRGVSCDIATLCLILALLVGIAAPIIMQSKLNEIYTVLNVAAPVASAPVPQNVAAPVQPVANGAPQQATASAPAPVASAPAPAASAPAPAVDVTEQIIKYKKLLDMGAITQEEYDAKKKQLLDI